MYEVGWTHQFANILGGTAEAMAVVFGVFLACLAAGGYLAGRLGGRLRRPVRAYGVLEVLIGLLGVASCFLLLRYEGGLLALVPDPSAPVRRLLVQCALVLTIIGPSSVLMGATLPIITEAIRGWALPSRQVSLLYGANTAGAALGALAPGVALISAIGLSGTAIVAMGANWIAATVALRLDRQAGPAPSPTISAAEAAEAQPSRLGRWGFLLMAALSGFQVLALEMAWGRLSRFVLGNRALAISALLFGVLLFLGGASLALRPLMRWATQRWKLDADQFFAAVVLTTAAAQALLGGPAAALAESPPNSVLVASILFTAQLALPFFTAGMVFPWLLTHAPGINAQTGRQVGSLYAANVAGSLAGSLGTTLVLLERLGTMTTLFALATCSLVAGGVLAVRMFDRRWARRWIGGTLAVYLLALIIHPWSLRPHYDQGVVLRAVEDRNGIFVLLRDKQGFIQAINNNVRLVARLGDGNTSYAQHLQADIPMLLAPDTHRIINIGTGFGITAGAFSLWGVQGRDISTIEILPEMVKSQPLFEPYNYGYFRVPGFQVLTGDGRHQLLRATEPYDIVSVNPLDPRLPGSSSLCTIDFWTAARSKLRPGGVYTQLVWGGQREVLLAGFSRVFPRHRLFRAYQNSYVLVGIAGDGPWPAFRVERLTPAVREAYRRLDIPDVEAFLDALREVSDVDTARWARQLRSRPAATFHTTDRPILEYQAFAGSNAFRTADEEWR
jgi:spermidine synthase